MNKTQRIITYSIVIVVVALLTWLATPRRAFTPTGLYLPATKQTFAKLSPEQVTLLQTAPSGAKLVGHINIEAYADGSVKKRVPQVEAYARQLAAANGASYIVVKIFGSDPQEQLVVFQARAYR